MKAEAGKLVAKAQRAIRAARTLLAEGDPDFAAGRAYYAMFYLAEALLDQEGLHFRKHAAVHAAFGEHFAKTGLLDAKYHRWLVDAFDKRIVNDYEVEATISQSDAGLMIDQAEQFLEAVKSILSAGNS
jgi:uncharacterized protein (UPF0332 family)